MKKMAKQPRLLPNVVEAIASLRERSGSSQKQIIEHICSLLRKSKHFENSPRNLTMQVRRALEHGLQNGLLKLRSGRYSLGMDRKGYDLFRKLRHYIDSNGDCNSCKRRKGRRGKSKKRRRKKRTGDRRRRVSNDDDDLSEGTESEWSATGETPEPMDKSRRKKRRKGKKGRRRYRRNRRRSNPSEHNSEASDLDRKDSLTEIRPENHSDQEKEDYQGKPTSSHNYHQERNQQERKNNSEKNEDREQKDCGNPDCLCNINQSDPQRPRDNSYYHDSYLN